METNTAFMLFTLVSPMLIAVVKQQGWSTQMNSLVALLSYVVIGILGALFAGETLSVETATQFISQAVVFGTAAYQLFWKNWGDTEVKDATSVVKTT